MPDHERERLVIDSFCDRLSALLRSPVTVTERPELQGTGNIEAIVEKEGRRWALDHRHLNSFKNHVKDDKRFLAIARPLEKNLEGLWDGYAIRILIPVRRLPKGDNNVIRALLEASVRQAIPTIPQDGTFQTIIPVGLKCELSLSRIKSEASYCFVSQLIPNQHREELGKDLEKAIVSKAKQLAPYRLQGMKTILLLDTQELSCLNHDTVAELFEAAAARADHSGLDEIYLFDNPWKSLQFVWPLKFRSVLPPDKRWINEFDRAQCVLIWKWKDSGHPFISDPPQ